VRSPYCTARDGRCLYRSFQTDSGANVLAYRLPYLNPRRNYVLRVIAYHEGKEECRADLFVDSCLSARISAKPRVPETLWVRVPEGLYRHDARVDLTLRKTGKGFVALAELKLFQAEEPRYGGDGGQAGIGGAVNVAWLYQNRPNPFSTRTAISYQLAQSGEVALDIFALSGSLVCRLVDQHQEPGFHSVRWDGRDSRGRAVAAGVYFYRLTTGGFAETWRAVLVR